MKNFYSSSRLKFYSTLFTCHFFSIYILFLLLKSGATRGDWGYAIIALGFLLVVYIINIIVSIVLSKTYESKNKENKKYLYIPIIYFFLIFIIPISLFIIPNELDKIMDKKNQKLKIKNEIELVNSIKEKGVAGCTDHLLKQNYVNVDHMCFNKLNELADNGTILRDTSCDSDFCKYNNAINENSSVNCYDMKSDYWKAECASKFNDFGLCNNMPTAQKNKNDYRSQCFIDILENGSMFKVDKCKEISEMSFRDRCIMQNAVSFKDCLTLKNLENLPFSMENRNYKDLCIFNVSKMNDNIDNKFSITSENINNCFNIDNQNLRHACIGFLATTTSDCDNIIKKQGDDSYDLCLSNVATKQQDIEMCSNVSFYGSQIRYDCVIKYAKKLNISFCDAINKSPTLLNEYKNENCDK